jgi:hypothetical protein
MPTFSAVARHRDAGDPLTAIDELRYGVFMVNAELVLQSIVLPVICVALLACTGNSGTTGGTGGSGGGTGGSGGEGGGAIVYPVCMDNSTVFTGTIDEQPYDQIISSHNLGFAQVPDPPTMSIYFDQSGELILHWTGDVLYTKPQKVYGTLTLPIQSKKRTVVKGSTMILQNNNYYKFDLFLDSGHLVGCANVPP